MKCSQEDKKAIFKEVRAKLIVLTAVGQKVLEAFERNSKQFIVNTVGGEHRVYFQAGRHLANPILTVTYSPDDDILYFQGDVSAVNLGCYFEREAVSQCLHRCKDYIAKLVFSELVLTEL